MSKVAVLTVGADGLVSAANVEAVRLLGWHRGKTCAELVRACDALDRPVCSRACHLQLEGHPVRQRDQFVRVAGAAYRLVCTALEHSSVVTLLPVSAATESPGDGLSVREREVLDLVATGLNSRSIARQLGIAISTVRTHVEHARTKLGAHTRAEAVALARR